MAIARLVALFACAVALAATARPPQWTVVDLGTLGGNFSIASGVANNGAVAGYSVASNPDAAPGEPTQTSHAFLWTQSGGMTDLGQYPHSLGVTIVDMNENGTLIGTIDGNASTAGGVVWRDGMWTYLAPMAFPRAINNAGMIVGQHGYGVHVEAFVYTGSALLGLGTLGGTDSYAFGVNDRGQVVGASYDAKGRSHAFVWQDGLITDLGTFDGENTGAIDINNNGLVLVSTQDHASGMWTPIIWDGSVARKLFTPRNGTNFYARAMNDRGEVIGQRGTNEGLSGWLFSDGRLTILDEIPEVVAAGLHDLNPSRINNRGWIVGASKNARGEYRGFLLIKRMLK